ATKPSQIKENVKAAGVKLEAALMREIDDVLGKIPERSPDKTKSPTARP
ncbi:MAG: hypothetical protein RLZZ394_831, partial [Actinomycetota bacterium]